MRALHALLFLSIGCGGTTGSALVTFAATASGPADITGDRVTFTTGAGAEVTLTRARLHVGALYLNQSVPVSGAASEPCISPGIYVGEVFGPLDVDLLSPNPQAFPTQGEGTQTEAKNAEVWLTGGDVNASEDATVILDVAGTANQGGESYPFSAALTIGANRMLAVRSPAMPGANPICHQRIVTPIVVDITPSNAGTLELRIDPRRMFNAVDFASLTQTSDMPPAYVFPDTNVGAGAALFKGMFASSGVYAFSWNAMGP